MKRFPAYIALQDHPVLIVGGDDAALRKARLMIAAGADVTMVWPDIAPVVVNELENQAALVCREPMASDFEGARLVFITISDDGDARRWAGVARGAGALVNVVDNPALCDFTTPSIIDRGRLTVAVSTDGAGPVYGRVLRREIEAMIPKRADALLNFAGSYRAAVKGKIAWPDRRAFWEAFFDGPIAAQVLAGDEKHAHEAMLSALNEEGPNAGALNGKTGIVHIVGAGPGDPELLTLKAFRLIQSADVILHDRLVSDGVLALARRDADRLYVGKEKANHAIPQDEIEARMIALAREGKIVVRLKGGDPFIFGRGGEELEALRAAGVPAYVTPGITAATGCAASAGMALTHRDFAQAVTFVTGHAKDDADPALDWAALAALKNTLVVYMGVGKAGAIASNLMANGRAPATPVAVIENGTCENEIILKGVLGELTALIDGGGITGPALLVIGETAALADGDTLQTLSNQTSTQQEKFVA
jgi:uroporphyrin-III C-methyltransferase / precorrin-2 dehydrogenase / sirohydrochlorin ferrochelatase